MRSRARSAVVLDVAALVVSSSIGGIPRTITVGLSSKPLSLSIAVRIASC